MASKGNESWKGLQRGTWGTCGAFLSLCTFFNYTVRLIDWVARIQFVATLNPYFHYLLNPVVAVFEIPVAAFMLYWATAGSEPKHRQALDDPAKDISGHSSGTDAERSRSTSAVPERAVPKWHPGHWFWIKLSIAAAVLGMTIAVAFYKVVMRSERHAGMATSMAMVPPVAGPVPLTSPIAKPAIRKRPAPGVPNRATSEPPPITKPIPQAAPTSEPPIQPAPLLSPQPIPRYHTDSPLPKPTVPEPYGELQSVRDHITALNQQWTMYEVRFSQDRAWPYKMGQKHGPIPDQLSDDELQRIVDEEASIREQYLNIEPQIKKARENAVAYMNLTPNQMAADDQLFVTANSTASARTPIKKLSSSTNPQIDRFSLIIQYLDGLIRRLGDYH